MVPTRYPHTPLIAYKKKIKNMNFTFQRLEKKHVFLKQDVDLGNVGSLGVSLVAYLQFSIFPKKG